MRRDIAKGIKKVSEITGKSEKSLKREYYKLSDKDKATFRKEIKDLLNEPDVMKQMLKGDAIIKEGGQEHGIAVSPEQFETLEELMAR